MSKFQENVKTVALPFELPQELTQSVLTLIELFYNNGYEKALLDSKEIKL